MKFGSLKSKKSLDGELCLISRDLKMAVKAIEIAASLREALEDWNQTSVLLQAKYDQLNQGRCTDVFSVEESAFASALPRTWLFADGSAFIHHIKLVRMARKAPLPETLNTVPLMYQGESGQFLDPHGLIPQMDFSHGTDFEGEVGVITSHVPMGISPQEALEKINLVVLINDVSLRGLIPEELAQGFGFFQSKPASALSPFAVTPDELGEAWKNGRIHLPLEVQYNNSFFGKANAKEMQFHFGELIAHAAKTRDLAAGSLIGSGTVSNEDPSVGSSCLVERRTLEQINEGTAKTPYMKVGDRIKIEMLDQSGRSIFGAIDQTVVAASKAIY